MLLLLPVVFILQTYISQIRHVFLSGALVLGISLSIYGVGIFSWAVVYWFVGIVGGSLWKANLAKIWRMIMGMISYISCFAALILIFGWLVELDWKEIMVTYDKMVSGINVSFVVTAGIGIFVWGLFLSILADWLVGRILKQVDI